MGNDIDKTEQAFKIATIGLIASLAVVLLAAAVNTVVRGTPSDIHYHPN